MQKRLPHVVLLGAGIALWALSVLHAPWFTATIDGRTYVVELTKVRDASWLTTSGSPILMVAMMLSGLYFVGRAFFAWLLLLFGGPLGRSWAGAVKVAWLHPYRAYLQGALVLAVAIAGVYETPGLELDGGGAVAATLARSWGGPLMIVALVLVLLAIYLIARDPELAATQLWADAKAEPKPKPKPAPKPAPLPTARALSVAAAPSPQPATTTSVVPPRPPPSAPTASTVARADDPDSAPRFLT